MERSDPTISLPRVSVVVPVRDDAEHLRRCLTDLARQSVAPWEVVVVDNGSSDGSAALARSYGARVVTEPVVGVPAAAARGYDSATGEVIARCDADSRLPRDWVARVAGRFASDEHLDGLTGPGVFYDLAPRLAPLATVAYLAGTFAATGAAMAGIPLWGSNMALRRSAWERVRHLVTRDDPELHDDLDLSLALGPRARIVLDPCLRVGVAGRMFHSPSQASRRVRMAMRTLRHGWASGGSPGLRWVDRLGVPIGPGLPARPAVPDTPGAEQVVLLDAAGHAIGTAPKRAVHHESTPLHLAFSCYVVDDQGRVLVTRRARDKATFPGVVTNSVCGHPAPGEDLAAAVARRAADELGLRIGVARVVLPGFAYRAEMDGVVEHELCPVHVAELVGAATDLAPDPTEVDDAWWVPWPELRDGVLDGSTTVSPWCADQVALLADLPDDPRDWPVGDPAALPPAVRDLRLPAS
ncbi:isopentenyl-diphosphate Delta-isomerase [Arsenicicoccus bolidensis]|uniref:Isopentenyl-diphosphate Delta-isomerase n=1 Tax=Arsenicicoccus bolidensis TaxID=229480 RepID=A0ABS9PZM5_9MICO|nr:isopentenyl-diphosphate Delta-isomerase [Arsenicicoccus bolidensis]MCG7320375.1 isopentenyl-diphosphate Delta-isomerase [Arsenicicoccus bolidensis]